MHSNPTLVRCALILTAAFGVALLASPAEAQRGGPPPPIDLDKVSLPPGFEIEIYAEGLTAARQMTLADDGTIFVGSFGALAGVGDVTDVYAVRDRDGDSRAEDVRVILSGLTMPHGVAFRDGALYVGEQNRVVRYPGILTRLDNPPAPEVVTELPVDGFNHSWKYIEFGPDGKLYIPIGAPCNTCERDDPFAGISRVNPDGSQFEVYARGVRNSVGLAFDPNDGSLWFTDNGRDMLGDNIPSDELNHATARGQHFGFPYCHQGDILDPELGGGHSCANYRPPVAKMGPHVAAIGMTFYTGDMFPAEYKNQIFVAEHGSWNRSTPLGYRVAVVRVQDGYTSGQEVFAGGFYDGNQVSGRPADLLELPDGSLLVSDDLQGVIYRISYSE